jgi:hypothetical protein
MKTFLLLLLLGFVPTSIIYGQIEYEYAWLNDIEDEYYRIKNIPVPEGYVRVEYSHNTYQEWLRNLPLKKNHDKVYLFDNSLKSNQNAHYKIIDIDVGDKDLQQCADAIMRLYSEYLYSQKKYDFISFNFTSGDRASFNSWVNGLRPIVDGNKVLWKKLANYDLSYDNFRKYLNIVFTYAGSFSLSKELVDIKNLNDLQVGDVFIRGGFPGHGVIVVDLAFNLSTNNKIFMIAQSYMPAQEIHILKNVENDSLCPWYKLKSTNKLYTPEWTFDWVDLKRFPEL